MTLPHEEMGDSCDHCGNSYAMCGCKNCVDCKDKYAAEDLQYGFCPDCYDDFSRKDLEDRIDILMLGGKELTQDALKMVGGL